MIRNNSRWLFHRLLAIENEVKDIKMKKIKEFYNLNYGKVWLFILIISILEFFGVFIMFVYVYIKTGFKLG